jgi:hypothetical protein
VRLAGSVGRVSGAGLHVRGVLHDRAVSEDLLEHWPEPDEPIVFVVGAGFSRAVSDRMPLTDELGEAALEQLRPVLPPRLALERLPDRVTFEAWLSQLAAEQPYLPDAENAENRDAFLRFSEAIAQIVGARVEAVLADPYPEWLLAFVSAAHHTRATVITFNYDTLIECMVATPKYILGNPNESGQVWQGVAWTELTGGLPPWPPGDFRWAADQVETLRLLKLHGSLNWYWRAGDSSGVSVARRDLPGWFGEPQPYDEEQRRRALPGRTPFVVPPSASKSDYYANPITQEMWRQAAERLRHARRLVFMGYSMPLTDVTFTNMLRDSLNSDCEILVVDYSPSPVVERLTELGISPERIGAAPQGAAAIRSVIEAWTEALSITALLQITNQLPETRMVLAWGDGQAYAPIERFEVEDGEITAIGDAVYSSFIGATGIGSRPACQIGGLRSTIETLEVSSSGFRASTPGSSPSPVIGWRAHRATTGQGSGAWLVLQVAATPPSTEFP